MSFVSSSYQRGDRAPLDEIKSALRDNAEGLFRELFGEPNHETLRSNEWRWNGHGSLAAVVRDGQGKRRGSFYTFEEERGGGPLDAVMYSRGLEFRQAVEWSKSFLGITPGTSRPETPADVLEERARRRAEQDADAEAYRLARIESARRIWAGSVSPTGTLGATYLANRGIVLLAEVPPAVRWHPASKSLVFAATRDDGSLQAVQRVYVGNDGRKVDADEVARRGLAAAKVTTGPTDGAAVRLPAKVFHGGTPGPLLLNEGPETGLSTWVATGIEAWVGLGGIAKHRPPLDRLLIVCRDDDPIESPADKALRRATQGWRKAGATVAVASPWPTRRHDKSDFNDSLVADGPDAVAARIAAAMPQPDPPDLDKGLPAAEASEAAGRLIADFFDAIQPADPIATDEPGAAAPPAVHGLRVDVSVGKSHHARKHAVDLLHRLRAAGDTREVSFAVPTHKLGDEQHALIEQLMNDKLVARVWRGRTADDPDHPGQKMCQDLEAVADAASVGADIQASVCRRKKRGEPEQTCPFFKECAYQAQRRKRADLWLVPHELLYTEKPTAFGDLAALIIDESAWQDSLEGCDVVIKDGREVHPSALTLSLDAFGTSDRRVGDHRNADWLVLERHRNNALRTLRSMDDGPIRRDALSSLTEADCVEAKQLEFLRKINPMIAPGMSRAERRKLVEAAESNRLMFLRARAWKALACLLAANGPEASGWVSLATVPSATGPQRVLQFKGRKDVRAGWQVPTLIIDALHDPQTLRPLSPHIQDVADIKAAAPHQTIRQVTDRAFSKSRLAPLDEKVAKDNPTVAKARLRALREVRDIVTREARRWPKGRVLLVAQKGVKGGEPNMAPGLIELGLPPNVETAHHNSTAGRDIWKDVRQLIVVGRTMPRVTAVERRAEALTGAAVPPAGDYDRISSFRRVAGRGLVPCETVRHPHPVAEACRWQICEGELVQIIGRPRGIWRTVNTPADVLVLTDPVLPMTIDEELTAADVDPSLPARMLGEGGVVFGNTGHAARAYSDLWEKPKDAENAFARGRTPSFPYEEPPLREKRESSPLLRVRYQRTGPGQKTAEAWFDPFLRPDPEAFLAERLGPLISFEFDAADHYERPASAGTEPQTVAASEQSPTIDTDLMPEPEPCPPIDPGSAYPKAETPSRPGADLNLSVRTADGNVVDLRPRPTPRGDPSDGLPKRAASMWDAPLRKDRR